MQEKVRRKSRSRFVTSSYPLLTSRPNRAMCLVLIYFFSPPSVHPFPLLSSPSSVSFFPLFRESGRRKREVAELQKFGSLSHPSLELSTTAPLVRDWEGVCLFLSQLFPPFTQDPFLCTSLISDLLTALLSRLPLGARGIYQEDNDNKFSSQSFYITNIISFFLQKQTQWNTATSAQGKF